MTVFDKKLKIWIIDDLQGRRDSHEKIIQSNFSDAIIVKIAHPAHLDCVLAKELDDINSSYNLFFSDFNMQWHNVEWTDDLKYKNEVKENQSLNDFPGTQKVLTKYQNQIENFLLVMLSTMVVENGYPLQSKHGFIETLDKAWEYEHLPLNSVNTDSIHKLTKPFTPKRLFQAIEHYQHLIKHLTK